MYLPLQIKVRSGQSESNRRPIDLQSIALPTELCPVNLLVGCAVWR